MQNDSFLVSDVKDTLYSRAMWRLNQMVVEPRLRKILADIIVSEIQSTLCEELLTVPVEGPEAISLKEDGYCDFGVLLTKQQVDEVSSYFLGLRPSEIRHNQIYYDKQDIFEAPHVVELMTSRKILDVVHSHLGVPGTINDVSAWRSERIIDNPVNNEIFHRDRGGFRQCKLFLYLTDVDESNGPHQYVKRSNDLKFVTQNIVSKGGDQKLIDRLFTGEVRALSEKIEQLFGDNVISFVGPSGTCFMTDNYGIHRGQGVLGNARMVFQVLYSLSSFPNKKERSNRIENVRCNRPGPMIQRLADNSKARYAVRLITRKRESDG